jgi:hypothetical protein
MPQSPRAAVFGRFVHCRRTRRGNLPAASLKPEISPESRRAGLRFRRPSISPLRPWAKSSSRRAQRRPSFLETERMSRTARDISGARICRAKHVTRGRRAKPFDRATSPHRQIPAGRRIARVYDVCDVSCCSPLTARDNKVQRTGRSRAKVDLPTPEPASQPGVSLLLLSRYAIR